MSLSQWDRKRTMKCSVYNDGINDVRYGVGIQWILGGEESITKAPKYCQKVP